MRWSRTGKDAEDSFVAEARKCGPGRAGIFSVGFHRDVLSPALLCSLVLLLSPALLCSLGHVSLAAFHSSLGHPLPADTNPSSLSLSRSLSRSLPASRLTAPTPPYPSAPRSPPLTACSAPAPLPWSHRAGVGAGVDER